MTCEQSRDEYIAAVEDLTQMSRLVTSATDAYIRALRENSLYDLGDRDLEWRRVTEGLRRLCGQERRARTLYEEDARRHQSQWKARGESRIQRATE